MGDPPFDRFLQGGFHRFCNRRGHQWWDGVAYLSEGRIHRSVENKSVRETLQSRRLPNSYVTCLLRIMVDVRVSILAYVRHQCTRSVLHVPKDLTPAIAKKTVEDLPVGTRAQLRNLWRRLPRSRMRPIG
jgi:hypothetical protein